MVDYLGISRVCANKHFHKMFQVSAPDVVIDARNAPLQEREEPFDRVRVDVPLHVDLALVEDGVVLPKTHRQGMVAVELIRHHVRVQ